MDAQTSEITAIRVGLQLVIATFWLGVVIALSFVETPLKFLIPEMTLPIAVSLGRLVFDATNIAGVLLAGSLSAVTIRRGMSRGQSLNLALIWVVLAVEVALLRPALASASEVVISGGPASRSSLHVLYIVAESMLVCLLIWFVVASLGVLWGAVLTPHCSPANTGER